jgi:hypothetical protein
LDRNWDLIEQTALKKIVPKTTQKSNRNWDYIIKEASGVETVDSLNQSEPLSFKDKINNFLSGKPVGNKFADTLVNFRNTGYNMFAGAKPGDRDYQQPVDTGSKLLNTISGFAGSAFGLATPMGGGAPSLLKAGTSIGDKVATKATSKLGQHLLHGATAGAVIDVGQGLKEGDDTKQLAKRVGKGAAIGTAIDLATYGLGRAFRNVKNGDLANAKVKIPTAEPELAITKTTTPKLKGKFKVKKPTAEVDRIAQEWNEAIEKIHNHFRHYKLTPEEVERIKPELGIDLDDILRRWEKAQKIDPIDNLRKIGEKRQLARVAGVEDVPNMKINNNINIKSAKENLDIAKNKMTKNDVNTEDLIRNIAPQLNDIGSIDKNMTDIYRNFKKVFKDKFPEVKKRILDPFDEAKKQNIEMQKEWTDKLKYVTDTLGINKKSKLSKAVQDYGEGTITLDKLKELHPKDWKKVIAADKFFRDAYDELLDTINQSRITTYGEDAAIPKRKDYYRHFRDLTQEFAGVKKLFDSPSQMSPELASKTDFIKPLKKYFGAEKARTGSAEYTSDAVGGFLDYLRGASYATHIDPQIVKFRNLAKTLAEATQNKGNVNTFIEYLDEFADNLSGKSHKIDNAVKKVIGERPYKVLNWLNKRAKANMIVGKASSALAQIANIPQGIATVKNPKHLTKAAGDLVVELMNKAGLVADNQVSTAAKRSPFLNERYSEKLYTQFDRRILDQPKKFAGWLLSALDEIGTRYIWNAQHRKALAEGIENPIKYADDVTRSLVAGRGVGEVPLLQQSDVFQTIAPFQVEVGNLWNVQRDMVKEKDFTGLAMLYLANNLLNKGMEQVRGFPVTFDPIQAVADAVEDPDNSPLKVTGRLAGEVLSSIPLGQSLASIVPEQQREEFFGSTDPTRFGGGLVLQKALQNPLWQLLPAYGGDQMRRSFEGLAALNKNPLTEKQPLPGVYNTNDETGKKTLKYLIPDKFSRELQAGLFGPSSTPEAREYYERDRVPLTEYQTREVENTKNPQKTYDVIQKVREIKRLENQMRNVYKNPNYSTNKVNKEIDKLQKRIQKLIDDLEKLTSQG